MSFDIRDLEEALEAFDFERASTMCSALTQELRDGASRRELRLATEAMALLQAKRLAPQVLELAETLIAVGEDNPGIRHRYALALANTGFLTAASDLLERVPPKLTDAEDSEIQGVHGRIAKARFLIGPNTVAGAYALTESIARYEGMYRKNESANYYHGINAAALLHRAAVDGIAIGRRDPITEAQRIAGDILDRIQKVPIPDIWQLATAVESCLVLDTHADAVRWAVAYSESRADSFEFGSTLRQFDQLWRLNSEQEPGRRLLPILKQAFLRTSGGSVRWSPQDTGSAGIRKLRRVDRAIGAATARGSLRSLTWLEAGLQAGRSVGRLVTSSGFAVGTCFLVTVPTGGVIILTNAHVIPQMVTANNALATFSVPGATFATRVRLRNVDVELDAAFLIPEVAPPLPALQVGDAVATIERRDQVSLIGHPHGSDVAWLSMDSSTVIGIDETWISHRSPSMEGHSGSPLLDSDWKVIGMHSRFNPPSHANRAVRLDRLDLC